jgi:phosphate transport system substrate-binding protein
MKASYWVFLLIGACNVINVNATKIKGSDTVLPLSQQAAENFMNKNPQARVTVTVEVAAWVFLPYLITQPILPWLHELLSSVRR